MLLEAAQKLLNSGIHHTKGDVNKNHNSFGRRIKSFHGGEELVSPHPDSALAGPSLMPAEKTKSILVFFKEIPLESFVADGRLGFAKQASKARSWTKKMYY